ncbi:MAG: hypothetical protein AAFR38_00090 [Planctomycetota bacterium]
MGVATGILERLALVSRVVSVGARVDGRVGGWYRGLVEVDCGARSVDLVERGETRVPGGRRVGAASANRWWVDGGLLRLAHLREGRDRPVGIAAFELGVDGSAPSAAEPADSVEPHVCDRDLYTASLWLDGSGRVRLAWRIETPGGVERLSLRYR